MTIDDALAIVRELDSLEYANGLVAAQDSRRAILARFRELRSTMGFWEASRVARAEWLMRRVAELSAVADTPDTGEPS